MSVSENSKTIFWQALETISKGRGGTESQTKALHNGIAAFGSETPDNLNCIAHISVSTDGNELGPVINRTGDLLSDIAWHLEGAPIPGQLAESYPELTQQEWDAFTRLTTLLHVALKYKSDP